MGDIFEISNAQRGGFKYPTFACFAPFFTIFSIFIREISKKRFWVQLAKGAKTGKSKRVLKATDAISK